MNDKEPIKLIEVAMPIREISSESVRDKSIHNGHISTLHLWWARRPLPVCRAVIFASLVPDPLDQHCPESFRNAVKVLLGPESNPNDPYKPYSDTTVYSFEHPMEDNLRNRLLMFIGKFSDTYLKNEKTGKYTPAKDVLDSDSLIKWENKNNEAILTIARKLIWVAHDPKNNTLGLYDNYYNAIKKAEDDLYEIPNRHLETVDVKIQENAVKEAIDLFLNRMPKVFDPFAGGGAIPLEAARLGCRTYANDINPVAHIIEKASLEFPQRYGKPINYSKEEFIKQYGEEAFYILPKEYHLHTSGKVTGVRVENRLAFDVEYYARKLLKMAQEEIGYLYPADASGNKPVAYYWARVATCANPSCNAEVPLLRDFYLVNKDRKKVYLNPLIHENKIDFEIKSGKHHLEGWMNKANLKCPCCGSITDVKILKNQFVAKKTKERMLVVILEGKDGKDYRLAKEHDIRLMNNINNPYPFPTESLDNGNIRDLKLPNWGIKLWAEMFSKRQLFTIQTLVNKYKEIRNQLIAVENEYSKSLMTYLGILLNRIAVANTSFGVWHKGRETLERIMSRQAIPMVFDYPESNPFCNSSGSGYNQIEWIVRYIESESLHPIETVCQNASSGDITQFENKYLSAVITDPPYYDAIAYADLSDFFYIWLKRTLSNLYPECFKLPQTPKQDECTAFKHYHNGKLENAKKHFKKKLFQIFKAIEKQTRGVVCIMFAHQSTEAWSTLCDSILKAGMNITGSWANDTEMTGALKSNKAFLESSITVSCRPAEKSGYGDYKEIKKAIERRVKSQVEILYQLGFQGADLITACFGQAVNEFGKYINVEKADGTGVTVKELLDMASVAAINSIVRDIETDEITRFYIIWMELFKFAKVNHDEARSLTQIGLNVDLKELSDNHILLRDGKFETITNFKERNKMRPRLGETPEVYTIDQIHKALYLYSTPGIERHALLKFLAEQSITQEHTFWRVLHSLIEVLPNGCEDHKQSLSLLSNKENLIRGAKNIIIDSKARHLPFVEN